MQATVFVLTKPWSTPPEAGRGDGQAENSLLSRIPTGGTDHSPLREELLSLLSPGTLKLGSAAFIRGIAAAQSMRRGH